MKKQQELKSVFGEVIDWKEVLQNSYRAKNAFELDLKDQDDYLITYYHGKKDKCIPLRTFIEKTRAHIAKFKPTHWERKIVLHNNGFQNLYINVEWEANHFNFYPSFDNRGKRITNRENIIMHPEISFAAFEHILDNWWYKTGDFAWVDSDKIEHYKLTLVSSVRVPKGYYQFISDEEKNQLCKYFLRFIYDANEYTIRNLSSKHLKRYKFNSAMNFICNSLYDLARVDYPQLMPWDMHHSMRGIFNDYDMRMYAIEYYMHNVPAYNIKIGELQMYASGVYGWYRANGYSADDIRETIKDWRSRQYHTGQRPTFDAWTEEHLRRQ